MLVKEKIKLRIGVACSTGGHMVEVKRLASVYEKYDYFYFTFSGGVARELERKVRVRTIPNITKLNPLSWISGVLLSCYIAIIERPDVVISTGAGVVVFFCIFAKLFGAKLIFLESMARVERPTLTARMLYPFSDLFIVQWEGLLKYFPKATYMGRVF